MKSFALWNARKILILWNVEHLARRLAQIVLLSVIVMKFALRGAFAGLGLYGRVTNVLLKTPAGV